MGHHPKPNPKPAHPLANLQASTHRHRQTLQTPQPAAPPPNPKGGYSLGRAQAARRPHHLPTQRNLHPPRPSRQQGTCLPTTHTGERNTTAPLHQLPMPVPAVCTRTLFHLKKNTEQKKNQKKLGGGDTTAGSARTTHLCSAIASPSLLSSSPIRVNPNQQDTQTAHNARIGEQAPSGQAHRTRTCTKGSTGTGRNGPHPEGQTHSGDPADPPGQWQSRHSKDTSPSPAMLHQGPWQTSPGAMEATDDRRARTQPKRGSPAERRGPATRATGVRWSYRRLARGKTPCGERYSIRLGSPQSCRSQDGACDPTHGHMWRHPHTRDTWTGGPGHCFPEHPAGAYRGT